ncbi:MAG: CpsD/CapB family tyrosine-protein kinase [Thiotrichaceae bacterium]|nr:CpsD/CapB family tyrosine-protein kinase [Thiotrichaceae bacterium]
MLHIQHSDSPARQHSQSNFESSNIPSICIPLWKKRVDVLKQFFHHHKLALYFSSLFISILSIVIYLVLQPLNITTGWILLLALLAGLLMGLYINVWHHRQGVRSHAIELMSGVPVIGVIPIVTQGEHFFAKAKLLSDPYSRVAEAYRITATVLAHSQKPNENKVILVSSINANEGKEMSAANLAYFIAELGSKVLLVDADFRHPTLHTHLSVANNQGLINFLLGDAKLNDITKKLTSNNKMFVITGGSLRNHSPIDLLSHENMSSFLSKAKKYFDYVIINSSPVRGFSDTLLLHRVATTSLIVVPESTVQLDKIKKQLSVLSQVSNTTINLLKVNALTDVVSPNYYRDYSQKRFSRWLRFKSGSKLNLGRQGRKYWSL